MVWMISLYLLTTGHWIVVEQRRELGTTCEIFSRGVHHYDPSAAIVCIPEAKS